MEGIQVSAYNVGSSGDIGLVQVGGYIDNVTSRQLEIAIEDVITQGIRKMIVDLAHVSYISSAGWGVFLGKIKGLREEGGDLVIAQMIPDVNDVFELLEFHRVLKSFESSEEAIKHFDAGSTGKSVGKGRDDIAGTILPRERETGNFWEDDEPVREIELPGPAAGTEHVTRSERGYNDEPAGRDAEVEARYVKNLLSLTDDDDTVPEPAFEEERENYPETRAERKEGEQLPVPSFYDSLGMSMTVMDRELPLSEKVKLLVIDNPLSGVWKIKKALNSSRFGFTKVGIVEIRKILKELDLDSKEKRYRFWRSR